MISSPQFLARYKPTFVYWHLDAAGRVLYVGCTSNLQQRDRAHRSRSSWYGQVAAIGRSGPLPWREARALERDKIAVLQPPYNVVHRRRADVEALRDLLAKEAQAS